MPTACSTPARCLVDISRMPADLKAILKLEVPVVVQIAQRQMPLLEVINLTPGAIIELPKTAEEELEILVNNKAIGTGRAVKVGENFGLRVSFVGDLAQRVRALGGGASAGLDRLASVAGPEFQPASA